MGYKVMVEHNKLDERGNIMPYKAGERVERNKPCPCGSGRKFKKCHYKAVTRRYAVN